MNCSSVCNMSQQKLHHAVVLENGEVFSCCNAVTKRITRLAKFPHNDFAS